MELNPVVALNSVAELTLMVSLHVVPHNVTEGIPNACRLVLPLSHDLAYSQGCQI